MFELMEEEVFTWPVSAKAPDPKQPGKYETVKFEATFNILSPELVSELLDADEADSVRRLLERALVSFAPSFKVPEGMDSDELNALLLAKPYFRSGLLQAFKAGSTGYKSKN